MLTSVLAVSPPGRQPVTSGELPSHLWLPAIILGLSGIRMTPTMDLCGFNHTKVQIVIGPVVGELHRTEGNVWQQVVNSVNQTGVQKEFTSEIIPFEVRFTTSELVLPSSVLYLLVVRFQFFYWLYFQHCCLTTPAHTDWSPDPRVIRSHYTFKPAAALADEKIQSVLEEIAQTAIQSIAKWCDQSRDFFGKRIQPLEEARHLIS